MVGRLASFVESAKAVGAAHLDETGTSPDAYKAEVERFLAEGMKLHLGFGRPVRLASGPSRRNIRSGEPPPSSTACVARPIIAAIGWVSRARRWKRSSTSAGK